MALSIHWLGAATLLISAGYTTEIQAQDPISQFIDNCIAFQSPFTTVPRKAETNNFEIISQTEAREIFPETEIENISAWRLDNRNVNKYTVLAVGLLNTENTTFDVCFIMSEVNSFARVRGDLVQRLHLSKMIDPATEVWVEGDYIFDEFARDIYINFEGRQGPRSQIAVIYSAIAPSP